MILRLLFSWNLISIYSLCALKVIELNLSLSNLADLPDTTESAIRVISCPDFNLKQLTNDTLYYCSDFNLDDGGA